MIGADSVGKAVAQAAVSDRGSFGDFTSPEAGRGLAPRVSGALHALASAWKWFEQKRVQQSTMRRLRISETISLGEKRSIWIVQVDGRDYLVGGSAGSVALLATLEKQPSFRETLQHQTLSTTEQA